MKRTRTALEAGALLCWAAGCVLLFLACVPAALLATGVLLGALSWVLDSA